MLKSSIYASEEVESVNAPSHRARPFACMAHQLDDRLVERVELWICPAIHLISEQEWIWVKVSVERRQSNDQLGVPNQLARG